MDNSTEALHPLIDFRRPVIADVSDDRGLTATENKPRLNGRLLAGIKISLYRSTEWESVGRFRRCYDL
jgi:hypothetical protein